MLWLLLVAPSMHALAPHPTHSISHPTLHHALQNKYSKAYRWDAKLKAALPWMEGLSAFNLNLRYSSIFQELNLAYAKHENVAGESLGPWCTSYGQREVCWQCAGSVNGQQCG